MVSMPPIETVSAIRSRRVRAALKSDGWRITMIGAALVGAVIGSLVGNRPAEQFFLAIGFAIVLVAVVLVVIWVKASGSAEDDFMTAWGRSHGLEFVESPDLGSGTPLLRQGDEQKAENGLTGAIDGHPAILCHYTYTVVTYNTDANGVRTRQESKHPFTVVRLDDVSAPIARMTLHPRSVLDRGWLDRADSALTPDRAVELESADLQKRYKLEVRDDVSDMLVRQIFEPSFIVWCLDEKDVLFELEDGELVVAVKHHLSEQGPLDALLEQSRAVLQRIAAASAPADRSLS
jgi:hypothetical protein